MPAHSEKQRRLMGAALAIKRGASSSNKMARKLARDMSERQLKDYASNECFTLVDYLLMCEFDDSNISMETTTRQAHASNPADVVTVDVPLLIRLMEYAREDATDDVDLHTVAENMVSLSANGKTLTMSDYDAVVGTHCSSVRGV